MFWPWLGAVLGAVLTRRFFFPPEERTKQDYFAAISIGTILVIVFDILGWI